MLALGLGMLFCKLLWLMFPFQLLLIYLFWTLPMAQLGYLHLTKAYLRCCNSFWKSSGLVQTVLAPWVSVPMTLYLADRLWWLFHCTYWSVWVDLQYTVMERELSASGVIKVSRKGRPNSLFTFHSKVDFWIYAIDMLQGCLFMGLLLDDKGVIHIPKPMPSVVGGGLESLFLKMFPVTPWLKIGPSQNLLHIHNNGQAQTNLANGHPQNIIGHSGHALNSEHVLRES